MENSFDMVSNVYNDYDVCCTFSAAVTIRDIRLQREMRARLAAPEKGFATMVSVVEVG